MQAPNSNTQLKSGGQSVLRKQNLLDMAHERIVERTVRASIPWHFSFSTSTGQNWQGN